MTEGGRGAVRAPLPGGEVIRCSKDAASGLVRRESLGVGPRWSRRRGSPQGACSGGAPPCHAMPVGGGECGVQPWGSGAVRLARKEPTASR